MIQPILPIKNVPDELLRAVNDRFRRVPEEAASAAQSAVVGLVVTHATRPSANNYPVGTYLTETDRTVLYQVKSSGGKTWTYVSGMMSAATASKPSDLGSDDAGFRFLDTTTYQMYRWSGSAWVEITTGGLVQAAYCNSALTLTGSEQDVANATLTLTRAGRHLITGSFYMVGSGAGDVGQNLIGKVSLDGSVQSQFAVFTSTASGCSAMVTQQWLYTAAAAGKIVKLRALKSGGTGSSTVGATHTSISALWIGP